MRERNKPENMLAALTEMIGDADEAAMIDTFARLTVLPILMLEGVGNSAVSLKPRTKLMTISVELGHAELLAGGSIEELVEATAARSMRVLDRLLEVVDEEALAPWTYVLRAESRDDIQSRLDFWKILNDGDTEDLGMLGHPELR